MENRLFLILAASFMLANAFSNAEKNAVKYKKMADKLNKLIDASDNSVEEDLEEIIVDVSEESTSARMCAVFVKYSGMALYGHNTDKVKGQNIDDCLRYCYFYTPLCSSVDYNPSSETCYVSAESVETAPEDFSYNDNTDYYHYQYKDFCSYLEESNEESGDSSDYDGSGSGSGSGYGYYW